MSKDIFENFNWHSSIGIDNSLLSDRKLVVRMPNIASVRKMFVATADNMLIHKTSRSLWKVSDDKKTIEPVFSSDILTEEELEELM